MPRLKPLFKYPTSFMDLMKAASVSPVEVPCASSTAAKSLRSELYFFRRALRLHLMEKPNNRKLHALYTKAIHVKLSVRGSALIAEPYTRKGQLVAIALKEARHGAQSV